MTIDEIRDRAAAATPGPWAWFGNTDNYHVELSTTHSGRYRVMIFDRWGMRNAQPAFAVGRERADTEDGVKLGTHGRMTPASKLPVYEVAPDALDSKDPDVYRADLSGIRNPDAVFLAAARQDVDDLLAEVDRLTELLVKEGVTV